METGDLDSWIPCISCVWQGTGGEGKMRVTSSLPWSWSVLPLSPMPQATPIFAFQTLCYE